MSLSPLIYVTVTHSMLLSSTCLCVTVTPSAYICHCMSLSPLVYVTVTHSICLCLYVTVTPSRYVSLSPLVHISVTAIPSTCISVCCWQPGTLSACLCHCHPQYMYLRVSLPPPLHVFVYVSINAVKFLYTLCNHYPGVCSIVCTHYPMVCITLQGTATCTTVSTSERRWQEAHHIIID